MSLGRILERLDRRIGNSGWLSSFVQLSVFHLPRIGSDHNPLLVKDPVIIFHRPFHFRYEHLWHQHPHFIPWVHSTWYPYYLDSTSLPSKLDSFDSILCQWHPNHFGTLSKDIVILKWHIAGIQASPSYMRSSFLQSLEVQLSVQYKNKSTWNFMGSTLTYTMASTWW